MNHPDQLSREYAAILPALKDHGYRADVKASIADERFILVVSGKPTTRIYRDGGWVRDDGARGSTPADLLSFYKHEHYTEALKHWTNKDWRGIARDLLIDNGVRMGIGPVRRFRGCSFGRGVSTVIRAGGNHTFQPCAKENGRHAESHATGEHGRPTVGSRIKTTQLIQEVWARILRLLWAGRNRRHVLSFCVWMYRLTVSSLMCPTLPK